MDNQQEALDRSLRDDWEEYTLRRQEAEGKVRRVTILFTDAEYEVIEKAARNEGVDIEKFIKSCIKKGAQQKFISKHRKIVEILSKRFTIPSK